MAFGIINPASNSQPQGTSLLESLEGESNGNTGYVVLVPEPSASPDDPLNFSRVRKELMFGTLVLGACSMGVIGPILVPGFNIVAAEFGFTSLTKVTLLNGSLIIGLGVSSYLCACLSVVYGKRLVYITTTLLTLVSCIWAATSKSYESLLVSRLFQGFGMGAFLSVAGTASINDIFFVHQRGLRVGVWNLAVTASINIAPTISAQVIIALTWRWTFWLISITYGVVLGCVILFLPETSFDRPIAQPSHLPTPCSQGSTHSGNDGEKKSAQDMAAPVTDLDLGTTRPERTKVQKILGLGTFEIRHQRRVLWLCVSPVKTLLHPAVIWSCLTYSAVFTWMIIQGAVAAQIFAAPPYSLSAIGVGNLVGVAPLIGSILGTIIGGRLCDDISKFMAKRNGGIFEPEFRLVIMVPFLITMTVGSFGLGEAVHHGLSPYVCGVFLAILNFAIGVGCTGIVAYSNDVCTNKPGEVFGIAMLIKSSFAFGLTFMLNDYLTNHGPRVFFATWGGLTVGVSLLTIPMYIFGKCIRAWAQTNHIVV
ncbi:hypothetical protein LTR84_000614 [Exophiala bonariae]|uniref:Major facilitator superfamily (MFS) profile domain-containing protein n=1 Tax=Exophiala bonariae TaxID=1690606 RepID=A0AAV9NRL8_9EURO|nr:hypothetical protein LTR84_000614 [Exophiala bonariae]